MKKVEYLDFSTAGLFDVATIQYSYSYPFSTGNVNSNCFPSLSLTTPTIIFCILIVSNLGISSTETGILPKLSSTIILSSSVSSEESVVSVEAASVSEVEPSVSEVVSVDSSVVSEGSVLSVVELLPS